MPSFRLVWTAFTALAAFAGILSFAKDLHGGQLHALSRRSRLLIVLALLAVSIAAALWYQQDTSRSPGDEQDRPVPELIASAERAVGGGHSVEGHLHATTSEPDAALQGIITANLTLDVTVKDADGRTVDTFALQERGGGFTPETAWLQARERLRQALTVRLQRDLKEVS